MASRGRGARQKGFQFERDIAKAFSEATGMEFKRGLGQTRGGGSEVSDVLPPPGDLRERIHIECKRQKRCNIKAAMQQARDDIAKRQLKAEVSPFPIAVTKNDREATLVTLELEDFLSLFAAWVATQDTEE